MKHSYDIGPDSWEEHDKYQGIRGVRVNDGSKSLNNLVIVKHINSK